MDLMIHILGHAYCIEIQVHLIIIWHKLIDYIPCLCAFVTWSNAAINSFEKRTGADVVHK